MTLLNYTNCMKFQAPAENVLGDPVEVRNNPLVSLSKYFGTVTSTSICLLLCGFAGTLGMSSNVPVQSVRPLRQELRNLFYILVASSGQTLVSQMSAGRDRCNALTITMSESAGKVLASSTPAQMAWDDSSAVN
jgi:hypothetical protein